MTLNGRIDKLEAKLGAADDEPVPLIVLRDREGRWWHHGVEIDRDTIDPRVRVFVLFARDFQGER